MPVEFGSFSHIGMVRENNEDSFAVGDNFAIIADGMGGHKKGETASRIAVETFNESLSGIYCDDYSSLLRCAMETANKKIFETAEKYEDMHGMGTTVISCAWNDDSIFVANVGDSRCYLIRNKEIKQISVDHSYVQHLISQGKITVDEAKKRKDKNLLTRAVGCEKEVDSDVFSLERQNGDIILLCSDGLTNMIDDDVIRNHFSKKGKLQDKVEKLIKLANKNGGGDNVTLVAVKLTDVEEKK